MGGDDVEKIILLREAPPAASPMTSSCMIQRRLGW
jgi:hypothetical protein